MIQTNPSAPPASAALEAVRAFWNRNPLFAGETEHTPGEKGFFEEHHRARLFENSGAIDEMFFRDVAPGREVLDAGCGIGFWSQQFALRGASVSACDLSDSGVALTRRHLELFGLRAKIAQANVEQLPYRDSSFDFVNCQGVIHHTPDTGQCLREFHRVLRPGGVLCFSVYYKVLPLRSRALFRLVTALTRPLLRMRGRGREEMMASPTPEDLVRLYDGADNPLGKAYTRKELRAMLAGLFEVLAEKRMGIPRRALAIHIPDGVHRLAGRFFGLMIVLRCRKLEPGR